AAHPYTAGLLAAIPDADPAAPRRPVGDESRLRGERPSSVNPPSGCRFRTRCPRASELCAEVEPPLEPISGPHRVACHFPLQPKRIALTKGAVTSR
ncbi:MAG: hypothetical protein J0H43_12320, partial [Actinobacteria bacterium]|nr:hypothetical protein [Actinomycetota bacterium]